MNLVERTTEDLKAEYEASVQATDAWSARMEELRGEIVRRAVAHVAHRYAGTVDAQAIESPEETAAFERLESMRERALRRLAAVKGRGGRQ